MDTSRIWRLNGRIVVPPYLESAAIPSPKTIRCAPWPTRLLWGRNSIRLGSRCRISIRGRRAIRQWIMETLPITDQRRYQFQVSQEGAGLEMEIALPPRAGRLPRINQLDGKLDIPGKGSVNLVLRPDNNVPGIFVGRTGR